MTRDEEEFPFDIRMVTPGTAEYEVTLAVSEAGQRNLDFYLQHEPELMDKYPGPCTVLVYNGSEARGFTDLNELLDFLETLDEVERSAALEFEQPEPGVAWVL